MVKDQKKHQSRDSNKRYYRQILFSLIFFLMVIIIGFFVKDEIKKDRELLEQYGIEGIAVVTERYFVRRYYSKYKFKYKNKVYQGTCNHMLFVGDTIDIIFYPKDPSNNRIKFK